MLPKFPNFKKIELSDRKDVENITSRFPPYSDFNFSSLWAWDLEGEMGLSILSSQEPFLRKLCFFGFLLYH